MSTHLQQHYPPQPAPMPLNMAANTVVMLAHNFATAPQLVTFAHGWSGPGASTPAPANTSNECEALISEAHASYRHGNYPLALQYCTAVRVKMACNASCTSYC